MTIKPEIGEHIQRKTIFEANTERSLLVSTADHSDRLFILSVAEETWVREIEDSVTYFNRVSAKDLLDHLTDNCDSLDDTDAVNIRLAIRHGGENL